MASQYIDLLPSFLEEGAVAPCSETDPEAFFPQENYLGEKIGAGSYFNESGAKAICKQCPYKTACLAMALERNEVGIWGGTTEAERRLMRRRIHALNLARAK
jgi:WhiB family redox-sensing transcriptional regulator